LRHRAVPVVDEVGARPNATVGVAWADASLECDSHPGNTARLTTDKVATKHRRRRDDPDDHMAAG